MNDAIRLLQELGVTSVGKPFFERITITDLLCNLLLAAGLSALFALVQRRCEKTATESNIFMPSLVLLSLAIASAMSVIGNDLARAFGLVGAVSIVRFRTSIKNSKEMGYVFLTIVIGMGCGLHLRLTSILITAISCGVVALLSVTRFGSRTMQASRFRLKVTAKMADFPRKRFEELLCSQKIPWEKTELTIQEDTETVWYNLTLGKDMDAEELMVSLKKHMAGEKIDASISLKTHEPE